MGGSNGGLLVGAVEVQRPDLFGACIPMVGVLDMLRFHQFTAGQFWRDEYGYVDNADEFKTLLAYSPYHNIKDGVAVPADADHDGRHRRPRRADAQLQVRRRAAAGPGGRRADPAADRNPRRPRRAARRSSKLIENAADRWAFLVKNLEMDVPSGELNSDARLLSSSVPSRPSSRAPSHRVVDAVIGPRVVNPLERDRP